MTLYFVFEVELDPQKPAPADSIKPPAMSQIVDTVKDRLDKTLKNYGLFAANIDGKGQKI